MSDVISSTYGDLPENVCALIEPHEWDNMTASEQRDWAIGALSRSLDRVEKAQEFEPRLWPTDTPADVKITAAKGFLVPLAEAFDALNGNANYTVTEIAPYGRTAYEVTVRRTDKPTPHELRKRAEAKLNSVVSAGEMLLQSVKAKDRQAIAKCAGMLDTAIKESK